MKIFNTLTRRKEEFVPLTPGQVKMYVCGPTVYNLIHIGNARPMIVFDTVRRYFEYKGYDVQYVSNFTDVDDINPTANNPKTIRAIHSFFSILIALLRVNHTCKHILELA